jgi:hypothetical protein
LLLATASAVVAVWPDAMLTLACAAVAVLFAYARLILMPKINAARDAQLALEHGAGKRFHRLRLQSVIINGLQLLVLLAIVAALLRLPLSG